MDDIAKRLGISSTALYRHFPNKYALFREELLRLSGLIAGTTALAEADGSPRERIDQLLDAVIAMTIANRATVRLTRWERRYLEPDDYHQLIEELTGPIRLMRALVAQVRPELSGHDRAVRAVAIFALTSSIGDHHVKVSSEVLAPLLHSASWAIIDADLTTPESATPEISETSSDAPLFRQEQLLRAAVTLFHERGYPNVSMEDIAGAANLVAASAVYRYYRGKSDLLATAFRRAAERASAAITAATSTERPPEAALAELIDGYVRDCFAERALTFVYYTEFGNVDAADQVTLRQMQQAVVTEWAALVVKARPELTMSEARVLVHACFSLVVDLGWIFRDTGICKRGKVIRILEAVAYRP
ncbi:hypothetical protein GCM10011591_02170 [Nocardia camponoti]|uniref:HTH tetR-type domain-containing protein n=2 Tax=Nocardia camponoti TaxID=1616106 RepID=A0A917V431_9NOCA|nr:hypothetical protein GCM10011591_02170 [Nocardia camponoti]